MTERTRNNSTERTSSVRNIGIIAHVDAGKTTLTEQLLFKSGAIRIVGRVDHGTAQTDSMEVERERGISVRAAATCLNWKGTEIRVIDTPGHADFYAEVERSVAVLDGAVLVISAVEGVQLQTMAVWRALRELQIPTLIFVNKLDRVGADIDKTLDAIRASLANHILPIQRARIPDHRDPEVSALRPSDNLDLNSVEALAETNEKIADRYLTDDAVQWSDVSSSLRQLVAEGATFPVLFGAAKLGIGVGALLDAIVKYLPQPHGDDTGALSAIVFKVENQKSGRLSFVRLFDGCIPVGGELQVLSADAHEKPARLLKLVVGGDYEPTDILMAGDIGALYGMQTTKVGYVIGAENPSRQLSDSVEPMLTARIDPELPNQRNDLLIALRELEDEDPLLRVIWQEDRRQIDVQFFGEIQMQIIKEVLATRFGILANFDEPGVLYKETPIRTATARVEHRENGFADIEIQIEPLPMGEGFKFESLVKADKVYFKFVKQIPQLIDVARLKGPRGWEVIDFKVTLIDGFSRYDLGTKPGDFKIVTPRVLADALQSAGTRLLEPMMSFEIEVPEEFGAQIYRDLMGMRAQFESASPSKGRLRYSGLVPFAETFANTSTLYASSHGQGILRTRFWGYRPVEGKTQ